MKLKSFAELGSSVKVLLQVFLLTPCIFAGSELPQHYPPDILPLADLILREDTAVGTFVCALNATSPQGYDITLSVISDFFALYSPNNSVYLATPLDFHTNRFVQFTVVATDSMQSTTRQTFAVRVTSSNLNPPVFEQDIYLTEVDEDLPLQSVIFDVTVNDADYGNNRLVVECITNENFPEACSIFGVKETRASNTFWKGQLFVQSPLNYETIRDVYQVKLLAIDGTRETIKNFEIKVQHPFSPPVFSSLPPATIRSDASIGTYITQVAAYDSNHLRNRSIVYDIEAGINRKFFQVDLWSGVVTLKQNIDLGDVAFLNGLVIDIPMIAREVIDHQNAVYGYGPRTASKQMVQVTITDVTTNLPRFDAGTYATVLPENIPNGQFVPGLFIAVTTARKDSAGQLNLVFADKSFYDIFYIVPSFGFGTINATFGVRNNSFLDYDAGVRRLDIVVIAIFNSSTSTLSNNATVILRVTNVHDKPPTFEFSFYMITVPMATRPGVVIAVFQARSFESSEVYYSLTGLGSDKFMVGNTTGQLTLTSCPTVTGNCLAGEARSIFNLTLRAVDSIDSSLQGSTLISIAINVSTSFPPSFTSNVYFYTARTGSTLLNTTAPISASPSSVQLAPVSYQLQASRYSDLFFINITSGILGLVRPISTSDVGANGQIILYVIASSNGATAIAQVIVQIELPLMQSIAFLQNYTASFTASTPIGTTIIQVTARTTDTKASTTYTIESVVGGDSELFGIDPLTGSIRLARNITYVGKRTYTLKVTAALTTDFNTTVATTYVVLTGSNILSPYFNPSIANASAPEDLAVGSQLLRLNAFVVDESIALAYELVDPTSAYDMAGNLVDKNTFNPRSVISLAPSARSVALVLSSALNRKAASSMLVTVAVKDNTTIPPVAAGIASVTIQVKASNRYVPTFTQGEFTGIVDARQAAGTYVTTLQAFDNDSDSVFYTMYQNDAIRGGSTSSVINIDRLTGVVTLKQPASSYQFSQPLTFIVQASDSYDSKAFALAKVSSRSTIPPRLYYLQPYYLASLDSLRLSLLTVQATSTFPETDYFPHQYDILGESKVTVNASTGVVSIGTNALSLDGLQTPFLVFYVTAFQAPRRRFLTRKTVSVPVYITVPAVKFLRQDQYITLPTTMPINSDVTWVIARSSNASADLNYSLLVNPNNRYAVDAASGRVSIARPWPANIFFQHNIIIQASDSTGASDNATVHISFASQNTPPYWLFPSDDGESVIMLENQPPNTVVTNLIQARDNESSVTYGIANYDGIVTQTREFAIDPGTGQIKTRIVLLADVADKYLLKLAATDSINQTTTRFLYIRILRSSGIINPVKFSQADYYFYIPPARSGACVMNPKTSTCGRVTITDIHTGAAVPVGQYVLAGGSTRCTFAINANGTILSTTSFCMRNDSYTLLVLVPGQSGSFANVHISIEGKSYGASFPIDSPSGSKILDVDRFVGIPVKYRLGDYLTYVSSNGTAANINGTNLIQVDSATGSVFLINALPPAWAAGNLQFTVLASDLISGTVVDNSSVTLWLPGEANLLRLRLYGPAYTTLSLATRYLQDFFSTSQVYVHSMTDVGAATIGSVAPRHEFEILISVLSTSSISLLTRSQIDRLIKSSASDTMGVGTGSGITIVKDTSLQYAYIYITHSLNTAAGMTQKPAESFVRTQPATADSSSLYYGLAAAVALLLLLLCVLLPVVVACCCCCAPCCAAAAGGKSRTSAQHYDITRKLNAWHHMTSAYGAEVLDEGGDYNYFEDDACDDYNEEDTNVDYYKTFVNTTESSSSGGGAAAASLVTAAGAAAATATATNGMDHIQSHGQRIVAERVFQNSWNRDGSGLTGGDAQHEAAGNVEDGEPVDVIVSGLAPGSTTLISELRQPAVANGGMSTAPERGLTTAAGSNTYYASVSRKQDGGSDGIGDAGTFSHTATVRRPATDAGKHSATSGRSSADTQRQEVHETFSERQQLQQQQSNQQGAAHNNGSGSHRTQRTVTETSEVVEEQRRKQGTNSSSAVGSRDSAVYGDNTLRGGSQTAAGHHAAPSSAAALSTVTSVSTNHPLTVILDANLTNQGMIAENAEYEIRPDILSRTPANAAATLSGQSRAAAGVAGTGAYTIELTGHPIGPQLASTVDEYEIQANRVTTVPASGPYYR